MKTNIAPRSIVVVATTVALFLGAAASLNLSSLAAEPAKKGAERLMEIYSPLPARESCFTKSAALHSDCASCQTVAIAKASATARGAEVLVTDGKPTKLVARHGCVSCSTRIEVAGHGKSKVDKVTHDCSMRTLASVSCCR